MILLSDVAYRVHPANETDVDELIKKGEEKLNIVFSNHHKIYKESSGDYWLTQLLCQSICLMGDVTETLQSKQSLNFDEIALRERVVSRLENTYLEPVKEFSRGRRFRTTNDPYLNF